jgi:hypothetical protein
MRTLSPIQSGPDVGRPMVNAGFADRRQCRGSTVRLLQSL